MFTGIIEEVGTVKQITHGQHSEVLNIQARTVLENTKIGDSIAVNGICLTVTRLFADSFSADVMHETAPLLQVLWSGAGSIWNGQWLRMDGSAGILWRVMWMAPGASCESKKTTMRSGLPSMRNQIFCAMSWKKAPSRSMV